MAHTPVNHPARPVYRAIGGLVGLYFVVFGGIGVITTAGNGAFAQDDTLKVLGQGANLGFSLLSVVLGALILLGVAIGRNLDVVINQWLAYALMVLGLAGLAFLRTDANILNFSVMTVIVLLTLSVVLLMAGMYGKVGTDEEQEAWQKARLVL
ncbi:protein of unknown function (DUF4383) [Micromonospora viridifaciens]|uniref:DUF4383 domain-containing protein n=1 Tax=Micromonospora viridifaciens TaxID=1881 RepID=A0A1C4ZX31_MICVI|nr:DUF4383 domain-containing protein [Micromonospora viridifaciens]SCF37518.1 protein of unknown function (DUF4383) [Micromonospora viridifaciens]